MPIAWHPSHRLSASWAAVCACGKECIRVYPNGCPEVTLVRGDKFALTIGGVKLTYEVDDLIDVSIERRLALTDDAVPLTCAAYGCPLDMVLTGNHLEGCPRV